MAAQINQTEEPSHKGALLIELARIQENDGDVDNAIASLRQAAAIETSQIHALLVLNRIARRHERWAEFSKNLQELAATKPDFRSAYLHEAAWIELHELDEPAVAMSLLQQAVESTPNDTHLHHELLLAAEQANDEDVARQVLSTLDEKNENDPLAEVYRLGRAIRLWKNGDADGAALALGELRQVGVLASPSNALMEQILVECSDWESMVDALRNNADASDGDTFGARRKSPLIS